MRAWMTLAACAALVPSVFAQSSARQLACNDPLLNESQTGENARTASLGLGLIYHSRLAPDDSTGTIIANDGTWPGDGSDTVTLKTDQPIKLGSLLVPVGVYSLFFLPSKHGWLLIVNKVVSKRAAYDESKDLGRVRMRAAPAANCKMLTIDLPYLPWSECDDDCNSKSDRTEQDDRSPRFLLRFAWQEANYWIPITRVQN